MGAKRISAASAGLLAMLAIALGSGGAHAAGPDHPVQGQPNIVVVMTDDQTQASLSKLTNVQSELVDQGTTFANNFTNWPLCCPSRSTFYSGQYAHNHGVLGNTPPLGGFTRFDDSNALPLWLKAAGYHTVQIGKYLNGYGSGGESPTYVPPGWDEWMAGTGGSVQSVYDYTLNQNGTLVDYGTAVEDFKQDVFTNLAVDAIDRNAPGGPFLLDVMYTAPHSGGPNPSPQPPADCNGTAKPAPRHATAFDSEPLPEPPSFNEADVSDKPARIQALAPLDATAIALATRRYRCRLEALLSVDEGVDRIVSALQASGELDNTYLIFTSDNGFFAGEHRVPTGKNRVYEEAIRVPLVIRGPDIPAGARVDDLSINADLAPTIVDAAGAEAGRVEDGRSLLPFASHPQRLHGRELLIEEGDQGDDEDNVNGAGFVAVRTSRYIYVDNDSGEIELYDLRTDPDQLTNLHANPAYAETEAALASRLATLRSCSGESCRTKPSLKLKLPRSVRRAGTSCRRPGDFVAKVQGAGAGAVAELTFWVGSKRAGHDEAKPLKQRLRPRLLRAKRKPEIRAIAELVDGRMLSLQKRTRICR